MSTPSMQALRNKEMRMSTPSIVALATGNPAQQLPQSTLLEMMMPLFARPRYAQAIFKASGIDSRAFVADPAFYAEILDKEKDKVPGTQVRNEYYMAEAMPLGEATIQRCLDMAGVGPEIVDDFFVVSCTGFDIPGLDLRLAGKMGMRSDLRRTAVLQMGCYGASPALWRAHEAVTASPERVALVLAIELSSLHLQLDDSLDNMVSMALFADGAAAALIGNVEDGPLKPEGRPFYIDASTYCDYSTFDHMAFHITDHGFEMRLSSYVPEVLAANVDGFVDDLLGRNGLGREDVRFWGIHPGGKKILDNLETRLGLSDTDLDYSRTVLREHGNMSSATIMFVIEEIERSGKPSPGDIALMMTFGPGLTMEGMLLKW